MADRRARGRQLQPPSPGHARSVIAQPGQKTGQVMGRHFPAPVVLGLMVNAAVIIAALAYRPEFPRMLFLDNPHVLGVFSAYDIFQRGFPDIADPQSCIRVPA
jgi:hypothetical protein